MNIESLLEDLTMTLDKIEDEGYWLEFKPTPSHSEILVHSAWTEDPEPEYVVTDDDEITEGESSWTHFKRETDG